MCSSTDSPTYKQTAKVNVSTNKQKSAEFVIGNLDASTQKNTITSITKNSDQQEEEHNVKSVPNANTDSGRFRKDIITNVSNSSEKKEFMRSSGLLNIFIRMHFAEVYVNMFFEKTSDSYRLFAS